MSLELRETALGIVIPVRVAPRASQSRVEGEVDGMLRVRLAAPPVEGAANRALVELIARSLGVPKRDVSIESGERSKSKQVLVRGVDRRAVVARLSERATGGGGD